MAFSRRQMWCRVFGTLLALVAMDASAQESARTVVQNSVTSDRLDAFLKAGPHAIIRSFLVEPAYTGKQFLGFKVVARTPHPVVETNALIQLGDIVVAANGIRLETPAQFMSAWRKLREHDNFSVDVLRGTKPIQFRWSVGRSENKK